MGAHCTRQQLMLQVRAMLEREREGIAKSKAEVQVVLCKLPTSPTRDRVNQNPAVRKLLDAPSSERQQDKQCRRIVHRPSRSV